MTISIPFLIVLGVGLYLAFTNLNRKQLTALGATVATIVGGLYLLSNT